MIAIKNTVASVAGHVPGHVPDHGPGRLSAGLDRTERRNRTINTEAGVESTVGAGAGVDRLLRNH